MTHDLRHLSRLFTGSAIDLPVKRMRRPLAFKFLALMLLIVLFALSSAFIFRHLIINDFRGFREGEREDRVYWLMARLEGAYADKGEWREDQAADHVVWALLMGLEIRLQDNEGRVVTDTGKALAALSSESRERLLAVSGYEHKPGEEKYIPYPLFTGGREIGRVDVRFLAPLREGLFEERANYFLLWSSLFVGMLAILLSIGASRRLARPLSALASAAAAIGRGELEKRVPANDRDEIGALGQAFNRMAEQLELQEKLRRKLFANAAHELRTPLAALRCELEGMIDGIVPVTNQQLHSLNDEIERLSRFLEGMEDLSRAEASLMSIKLQPIFLCQLLSGIVERYVPIFSEKGVTLTLSCGDDHSVDVDPERLSQIMVNLLGNALKATPCGGMVKVMAARVANEVEIVVEDTGCGIDPEEMQIIYERFYRGAAGGMGLGLAIVKELVKAHDGRVEAESRPGEGSRFSVYLPYHPDRN